MSDSTFTWGDITALAPLRVKLDGDTAALPFTPETLTDPLTLAVGSRVRCELSNNRVIIHGRSGGIAFRHNRVRNGHCRTNQRGIASGVTLIPGQFGFDGWRAAGRVNLSRNPRYGAAGATTTDMNVSTPGGTTTQSAFTTGGPVAACPTFRRHTYGFSGGIPQVLTNGAVGNNLVKGGGAYNSSVYIRSSAAITVYTDSIGLNASSGTAQDGPEVNVVLVPNVWTRLSQVVVAVNDAVRFENRIVTLTTIPSGTTIDITGWQLTEGEDLLPYFDGAAGGTNLWSSTAHASPSYSRPATTLTFTAAPQGQLVTISSGGGLIQPIERADVEAGDYVLSWAGTATGRVWQDGWTIPALAASGVQWTSDGLGAYSYVNIEAVGGAKTFGLVQLELGSSPTPFERIPIAQELATCQRYYYEANSENAPSGGLNTGGSCYGNAYLAMWFRFPVRMRRSPCVSWTAPSTFNMHIPGVVIGAVTTIYWDGGAAGPDGTTLTAQSSVTAFGNGMAARLQPQGSAFGRAAVMFDAEIYSGGL